MSPEGSDERQANTYLPTADGMGNATDLAAASSLRQRHHILIFAQRFLNNYRQKGIFLRDPKAEVIA